MHGSKILCHKIKLVYIFTKIIVLFPVAPSFSLFIFDFFEILFTIILPQDD